MRYAAILNFFTVCFKLNIEMLFATFTDIPCYCCSHELLCRSKPNLQLSSLIKLRKAEALHI